jgi:AcrR family transcriptional regulator
MARSARKTPTRDRLMASALELFSRYWFETVSIAEICRNAGLSNGIFYRYYKGKEAIFSELLERYLAIISERLAGITGDTVEQRLARFIDVLVTQARRDKDLEIVYREGQYRFPGYEKRLRDIFMRAIAQVYRRPVSEAEYLYAVSGVRFVSTRTLYDRMPVNQKLLQQAVTRGVFTRPIRKAWRIFAIQPKSAEAGKQGSREKLIAIGIRLFGTRGFYNVTVYDIAKEAGFSVGTFYLYFATKEAFLAEIVRLIGHGTRQFISRNLDRSLNRLEQELQGLYLFLLYFQKHKAYYGIVREAEFVVNDEVREYYDAFLRGYLKDLGDTWVPEGSGRRLIANALMGLSYHFGIDYFFSRTIRDRDKSILELASLLFKGMRE